MKRLLLLSVVFCMGIVQSLAQSFTYTDENGVSWSGGINYGVSMNDGSLIDSTYNFYIYGVSNYGSEVVVPEYIEYQGKKYPVKNLGVVFSYKNITKVTLPKTVICLNQTFYNCPYLSAVVNTEQILAIEDNTFSECESLQNIDLSACKKIGYGTFQGCTNLQSVNLKACTEIGENAFQGCNKLKTVGDLSTCKSIGAQAFNGCCSLEKVNCSNCSIIESSSFQNCEMLKEVDLANCTSIGTYAFWGCPNLETINTSNCTTIGDHAFEGCSNLETINTSNCTTIGDHAFEGCSNLETINTSNCTTIGDYAFQGSRLLKEIDLSKCSILGSSAFADCSNLKIVKGIENLTTIPSYAFYGTGIEALSLPNCINIEEEAFCGCLSLKSIEIPVCQTIGRQAFDSCNSLEAVSLPSTIKSLGQICFSGNTMITLYAKDVPTLGSSPGGLPFDKTTLVIVPEESLNAYQTANVWNTMKDRIFSMGTQFSYDVEATAQPTTSGLQKSIGANNLRSVVTLKVKGSINSYDIMVMRNKMDNLHYLDLKEADVVANTYEYYTGYCTKDSVLGLHSFADLDKLITVKLPKSVKYTNGAFANCTHLRSVEMPEELIATDLYKDDSGPMVELNEQKGTFEACSMLIDVTFYHCNTIGGRTFEGCSALENITLANNLKRIGYSAFNSCYNLKSIILPNEVESIGCDAFGACSSLKSVQFPPSLKTIDEYAFRSCSGLEDVTLPGLTTIAYQTFNGCSNLKEIKLPSTLESVGNEAFSECNNLNKVYTYTVLPINIYQNTFSNFSNTTLYVPTQSADNYYWSTQWGQFKEIKEFDEPYTYFYLDQEFTLEKRFDGAPDIDIKDNGALKVDGNESQEAGDVTIKGNGNDNAGTLITDGNLNAKNLRFDITVNANQWYFFSFPFDIDLAEVKTPGKYVFRTYDGSIRADQGFGGWRDLTATETTLKQGEGYIFQTAKSGVLSLSVSKDKFGELAANNVVKPLDSYPSADDQNASWNFIGNPQTSYMSTATLGYEAPITVWNGSNYEAIRPGDDELALKPFQAFFVQKPTAVSEIEFKAEDRLTKSEAINQTKTAKVRRMAKGITPSRLFINLVVSNGKEQDKTRIVFNEKKSQAYEIDCDASKFDAITDAPQLYSIEAKVGNLAINERPMGSVTLGFATKRGGTFTLSATRMDQPMLLQDKKTGATFDLTDGDYQFSVDAGTYNDRFVLVANNAITGLAEITNKTGVNIMPSENGIYIQGLNGKQASIYTTNGTLLATRTADGMLNLMTGVYIVKVNNMKTKVMVK